jgi:hypothetical protein
MTDLEQRLDAAVEAAGELFRLGAFEFPTGRIVVSDPYAADDAAPFERAVAPGKYELEIGRVDTERFGRRSAFARLRFAADGPATQWELAEAEDGDDGFFVDAGLAAFMDEQARDDFLAAIERYDESHPDGNYHRDRLAPDMDQTSADPDRPDVPGWWAFHRPEGSELQVAVFSSGLGDGRYQTFWGLTDAGDPATLVIDFGVV